MQQGQRLVIVGAGMAALELLRRLHELAPGRFQITLIGAEAEPAYNRVLLSAWLAGEIEPSELALAGPEDYALWGVSQHLGQRVTHIDRVARTLSTHTGLVVGYDILILACGSTPIIPAWPGVSAEGVLGFRTLDDVRRLLALATRNEPIVVIGGGLLGVEAASGLARSGAPVQLVHLAGHLLERQLDPTAGGLLQAELERRGIEVHLATETQSIVLDDQGQVCAVLCADGRRLPARWVVLALGIKPSSELARAAGLACERGILVDDRLATEDPAIYALGECAQHRGVCYGLVAPAWEQAACLAKILGGDPRAAYSGSVTATGLKVSGISIFSAGEHRELPGDEILRVTDLHQGYYRKLVVRDDRLTGLVLYGDTSDSAWYLDLLSRREPLGEAVDALAFGRLYCADVGSAAALAET